MRYSKTVCAVLAVIMIFTATVTCTSAAGEPDWYLLASEISEAVSNCEEQVYFSVPVNKTADNQSDLLNFVFYDIPEAFHVSAIYWIISGSKINGLGFIYLYTDGYAEELAELRDVVDSMTADLVDADISDAEKALVLHDRLAVHTEYDYQSYLNGTIPDSSYTAYGALVNRKSVCMGYTLAYTMLLNAVGIKSRSCDSDALNHVWNIVTINGMEYHVDVTFDDPVWDVTGRVYHDNFLISSQTLISRGHNASDFEKTPFDKSFEGEYWESSDAEIQYLGGELYYIDSATETLRRADGVELLSVDDTWMAGEGSFWGGNYSRLSNDGSALLYSLSDSIWSYNPETGICELFYQPDLPEGEYCSIYGFDYDAATRTLTYLPNTSPNCDANTKSDNQVVIIYPDVPQPDFLLGDINYDGIVDLLDLSELATLLSNGYVEVCDENDINSDGTVDLIDLSGLAIMLAG